MRVYNQASDDSAHQNLVRFFPGSAFLIEAIGLGAVRSRALMSMHRLLPLAALLLLLIGGRILATRLPATAAWVSLDYYTAYGAAHALAAGHDPYDPRWTDILADSNGLPRIRGDILGGTPFWVWVNQVLLPFPPRTAAWIWFLISGAAMLAGLAITETLVRDALAPKGVSLVRLRMAMFAFLPIWGCVFIGQSSPLVLLSWSLAAWLLSRKHPVGAACACAVAGAIKVFPAALLLWFAAKRQWRALGAGLLLLGLLQFPPCLARPGLLGEFVHVLVAFGSDAHGNAAIAANQSLWALVLRVGAMNAWPSHFAVVVIVVMAATFVGATALVVAKRGPAGNLQEFAGFAATMIAISLCAPFLWHHSYVMLWPVYAFVLGTKPRLGVLGLALVALQHVWDYVRPPNGITLAMVTSLAVASAVLCWFVAIRCILSKRG